MDSLYRDNILDHYKNPRNFGILDNSTASEEENPSCGDRIKMQLQFAQVKGRKSVKDIRFSGEGCAITIASASMLTEYAKGRNITHLLKFTTDDILKLLGTTLTPARVRCATLPLEVLQRAVLANK